jgi:hypothetical protein
MSCRETPSQKILRLLRKTRQEVRAILAIVSDPTDKDFSKEDAKVRNMTKKVRNARKRIPIPAEQNNKPEGQ